MIFVRILAILLVLLLTPFTSERPSLSQSAKRSHPRALNNNPYINNACLAYDRLNPPNGKWLGNHFDLIIGLNQPSSDATRADAVAANPDVRILLYINLNNCARNDQMFCTWASAKADPEESFINATEDSMQKISGRIYLRLSGQRMCASYPGQCANAGAGTRWMTNYLTPKARQDIVSWVQAYWAQRRPNLHGFFIDNAGPGGSGGDLVSGAAEYKIKAPYKFSGFNSPNEEHQVELLKLLNQRLDASVPWASNTATYLVTNCSIWSWPGVSNGCLSSLNGHAFTYPIFIRGQYERGIITEFLLRFSQDYSMIDRANLSVRELWEAKGSPPNAIFCQYWQPTGDSSVQDEDDRIKLWSLASHLLYQFDRLFYHYHSNTRVGNATQNASPESHWFDAQDVRIGTPTSDKIQMDNRTFKRYFTNGISVVRFRLDKSDNYTDSAAYELGSAYHPVIRADDQGKGIFGFPVTRITLRNQEGFIGVKSLSLEK